MIFAEDGYTATTDGMRSRNGEKLETTWGSFSELCRSGSVRVVPSFSKSEDVRVVCVDNILNVR
jgi:hypothetical protein